MTPQERREWVEYRRQTQVILNYCLTSEDMARRAFSDEPTELNYKMLSATMEFRRRLAESLAFTDIVLSNDAGDL